MTNEEAIKGLKNVSTMFTGYKPNEEMFEMAIKAMETVQRIDDVLNAEGMTADDAIHEIIVAIDEFKYDCGVNE